MSHKKDSKLAAVNVSLITTISPPYKMITSEKDHKNSNNILYTTPLHEGFENDSFSVADQISRSKLDEAVKKMKGKLMVKDSNYKGEDEVEKLIMIDTIQRLGIEYQFEKEIHCVLERQYTTWCVMGQVIGSNLHEVALRFRLLRQEGYHVVATDTFAKYKNDIGKFKQELGKDITGLMSLYEASQLSITGDDILDDAAEFCKDLLQFSTMNSHQYDSKNIKNMISNPSQRNLPRLTGQSFLNNMQNLLNFLHDIKTSNSWTSNMEDIARMDYKMAQITHQTEILQVSRWWKELQLNDELKLARDQPVKWYMWSLASFPSPSMREERIQLTKQVSFVYLMDDIFDLYGTLEDLCLFTEAINRWDYGDIRLPNYMKTFLRVFYDTTNEISHKIHVKQGWNPMDSIKKAWADLCNAFLVEVRWFTSGKLPKTEEYLKNGIISSGTIVVSILLFYLIGDGISDKTIDNLINFPDLITSIATILRLCDDQGTAKDENQDGYDGSFLECYMKEHEGSSVEIAQDALTRLNLNAWKCLNKERLLSSPFSSNFTKAIYNSARMIPMMYTYDDNQRLPNLEKHMKSFLYGNVDL